MFNRDINFQSFDRPHFTQLYYIYVYICILRSKHQGIVCTRAVAAIAPIIAGDVSPLEDTLGAGQTFR